MLASLAKIMADRYFSEQPISGERVTLAGSEAHHLLHVMRAKVGTEIILFDGQGGEWWTEVVRLGRADVELAVRQHRPLERELPTELTLALAVPKGDRQRWLVEKAVELGVTRLVPLTTSRSQPAAAEPAAKLNRYVVEASKQCGRNQLMEIAKPQSWVEFIGKPLKGNKLIAHPSGKSVAELSFDNKLATYLTVGPEGGLTEQEVVVAKENDWQIVGLGSRILRIETAALALVARLTVA